MKIKYNKENISKLIKGTLCNGIVLATLITGSVLYGKLNDKNNEDCPVFKEIETFEEDETKFLVYNGVTYTAPSGYTLEIINDHIYAIKRYYLVDKAKKIIDENGNEVYYVPDGSILVDDEIYRELLEVADPIIENRKSL